MTVHLRRRGLLTLAPAAALLSGCNQPAWHEPLSRAFSAVDMLTYRLHRLLLPGTGLVQEYPRSAISEHFPTLNTTDPEDATHRAQRVNGFADWRLSVTGLVGQELSLSLADLHSMPVRTQITRHQCVEGWMAIGEWTGVPLSRVLQAAQLSDRARYIVFDCADGWWDSIDLADGLHPQTILAYGMNGDTLSIAHGAPLRLRVERQLGYKSSKYLTRIEAVDRLDNFRNGYGNNLDSYQWYAGI